LPTDRVCESVFAPRWSGRYLAGNLRVNCLSILAGLCLLAPHVAHCQETETLAETNTLAGTNTPAEALTPPGADAAAGSESQKVNWFKRRVESEIIVEGLASYGNYKIFASGYDEKLYTAGLEYDRHSWGHFLKARVDYVAEFLPFVLLDKPLHTDIWGNPVPIKQKNIREYVPGIGFSPIGFRMLWRDHKAIKPYLMAKGGILVFDKKVPSTKAAYENLSLQSAVGVQVKMNERWDLRLGLFGDFHFSDAFIVPVNPGLDVMNASLGLSYHFGK